MKFCLLLLVLSLAVAQVSAIQPLESNSLQQTNRDEAVLVDLEESGFWHAQDPLEAAEEEIRKLIDYSLEAMVYTSEREEYSKISQEDRDAVFLHALMTGGLLHKMQKVALRVLSHCIVELFHHKYPEVSTELFMQRIVLAMDRTKRIDSRVDSDDLEEIRDTERVWMSRCVKLIHEGKKESDKACEAFESAAIGIVSSATFWHGRKSSNAKAKDFMRKVQESLREGGVEHIVKAIDFLVPSKAKYGDEHDAPLCKRVQFGVTHYVNVEGNKLQKAQNQVALVTASFKIVAGLISVSAQLATSGASALFVDGFLLASRALDFSTVAATKVLDLKLRGKVHFRTVSMAILQALSKLMDPPTIHDDKSDVPNCEERTIHVIKILLQILGPDGVQLTEHQEKVKEFVEKFDERVTANQIKGRTTGEIISELNDFVGPTKFLIAASQSETIALHTIHNDGPAQKGSEK